MPAPDPVAWHDAETIAAAFVRATAPTAEPPIVGRRQTVPFLFEVMIDPSAILVDRGRVVTARGLPALRAYLDASQLLREALPSIDDFQVLLFALEVWPPIEQHDGVSRHLFLNVGADPALRPRLERHGDRVEFHLCYALATPHGLHVTDPDQKVDIAQWTLVFEPGQAPLWTRTQRVFALARGAWVR